MFPVDSIKVSPCFVRGLANAHRPPAWGIFFFFLFTDTHASIRHVAGGDVHGDRKCVHANIFDRGRARAVAWRVVGYRGGRSSACGPLWNV